MIRHLFFIPCLLLLTMSSAMAQEESKLTMEEISQTIDSISYQLQENYVFPEVAEKMAKSILQKLSKGEYNDLQDPERLAGQLTRDLQAISKDKHLIVNYNPRIITRERSLTDEDRKNEEETWNAEWLKQVRKDNYGFKSLKIMEGNVGYLDMREFVDPKYAGEKLTAVMSFLSNTDAMIIDLRKNDGGSPAMLQLLASYFFDNTPVHLSDFYDRPRKTLTQIWTLPYVQGVRKPETDLYLLTSNETFSAAEAFSFHMKDLKRATIIGESTAGGAHLTGSVIVTDKFFVRIPQGRAMSPLTQTNWEGTGVEPHISIHQGQALEEAHKMAREKLGK